MVVKKFRDERVVRQAMVLWMQRGGGAVDRVRGAKLVACIS